MLYRAGSMVTIEGVALDWRIVKADEFEAAKAEGWRLTADAEPAASPAQAAPEALKRAELEALARANGLKFDGRTSDKRLAEMVK